VTRLSGIAAAAPVRVRPSTLWHLAAVGALIALTAITLLPAVGFPPSIPPYNPDNLFALSVGTHSVDSYFTGAAAGAYRPVTYLALWAQYHVNGVDPGAYFAVNMVLWIACGCMVYALGYGLGRSHLAAAIAAGLMLIDERAMAAIVWIIERQTMLACLLGGSALLLAYRLPPGGWPRAAVLGGITALALGAALSKETGLAFIAAIAAVGLVTRPRDRRELVGVALAAFTAYAAARTLLPADEARAAPHVAGLSGPSLETCEYIGFLGHGENVCYGDLDLVDRLLRWGWNAGATLVATFLPPLFGGHGELLLPDVLAGPLGEAEDYPGFSLPSLILPLLVSVCAFVGLRRHPRAVLPLFVLIVANAALNFLLFRDRNQAVGMVGLYAAAAVGLPVVASESLARARAFARRARSPTGTRTRTALALATVAVVAVTIAWRAVDLHDAVAGAKAGYADRDPCPYLRATKPDVAERLKAGLGSGASDCDLTPGLWRPISP
jgi:hypothetical protein